ncbi:MAG: glycosyltransferase family 4 protein [Planctomycetota bacterium]
MCRIKVLQVVTRLVVRGVPRHVLELAAGLDPERFQVDVLAGKGEPGEGSLWPEAEQRGIRTIYLGSLQRAVNPGADARALMGLYQAIREGRYDVVHTHISKAGVLGRLAARKAGVRAIVHTYHGEVAEVAAAGLAPSVFRLAERLAARATSRFVAVSQHTAEECLARGIGTRAQYRVIHNGIDLDRFSREQVERPFADSGPGPVVGVVGSLTAEKRVDVLLRAVQQLTSEYPALLVCVVGDGPLRDHLQGMAQQLQLGERVQFPGLVPDVRPWLARFDVLVSPSEREGLPTVLLEALAMGCPVVASRVGGVPEIIQHGRTGLLVKPNDPRAIEDAIRRLLRSPEQRELLRREGRRRAVSSFGLDTMLRRTEAVYDELLSRGSRRA